MAKDTRSRVGERRRDRQEASRCVAEIKGWVMVRRPHCIPYVLPTEEWDALPLQP